MAVIRVINHQTIDGVADTIEERGEGSLTEKNGRYYIRYETLTENGRISVTIIAGSGSVTIRRDGAYGAHMRCEEGKIIPFLYRTPYGDMEMETDTVYIRNELGTDAQRLKIVYRLMMQGQVTYNDTDIIIE